MTTTPLPWLVAADDPLPREDAPEAPRPNAYARRVGCWLLLLLVGICLFCALGPALCAVSAVAALFIAAAWRVVFRA